jgi:hypothetical protein
MVFVCAVVVASLAGWNREHSATYEFQLQRLQLHDDCKDLHSAVCYIIREIDINKKKFQSVFEMAHLAEIDKLTGRNRTRTLYK